MTNFNVPETDLAWQPTGYLNSNTKQLHYKQSWTCQWIKFKYKRTYN